MGKVVGLVFPQENTEMTVCPECGKEYKTESALKAHLAKEHDKEETEK